MTKWPEIQAKVYLSNYRNAGFALTAVPLHMAIWHSPSMLYMQVLTFIHVIATLLWVPFALGEASIKTKPTVIVVLLGAIMAISQSYFAISLWILILTSLLAGEPFENKRAIASHVFSILFLLFTLFLGSLPKSFAFHFDNTYIDYMGHGFLILLLINALIPQAPHKTLRQSDILPSLVFSQAIVIFAATAVIYSYSTQTFYLESLLYAIAFICLGFCVINLAWIWVTGNSVLSLLWNRYLLVLGSPFEDLLVKLNALSSTTNSPGQFLENSFGEMYKLPWVKSVQWRAASARGELGTPNDHELKVDIADLTVIIYTHHEANDSLTMHARLVVQLICHYYHTIKRERSLAHRAHVQALYETGARLTHDIKNLLQGLKMLSAAGEHTSDAVAFHELFKKQIPSINERLETTLRKLTEPNKAKSDKDMLLSEWWLQFKQRYQGRDVKLSARIDIDKPVPVEMIDTISENLLDNARAKRMHENGIEIEVRLMSNADGLIFSVIDTGSPVPAEKAQYLLNEPVKSEQGLGVGLYQSAALAKQFDYELHLNENMDGLVSFSLTKNN